jgi:hypothetical protein
MIFRLKNRDTAELMTDPCFFVDVSVYRDMLYPYVLQQIKAFAKSMKRRKVNSAIKDYADIQELTPEVLDAAIERIEISHVGYKSKPGSVIHIYWKLR